MRTALIIEDDARLAEYVALALEKRNFQTLKALNGEEGFRMAAESAPDVVLLDILLPGAESGEEVLRRLKDDPKMKDIPVMVFTNLANQELREKCLAAGCKDFLVKVDYSPDQIAEKVESLFAPYG